MNNEYISQELIQMNQVPMEIRKLVLVEIGNYQDQYIRSYTMDTNYEDVKRLSNVVEKTISEGRIMVNPNDIANSMSNIMLPSQVPLMKVDIPYGWKEKRYRFIMEIVNPAPGGFGELVTYIQGYTEFPGAMIKGNNALVDESMKFFINSVIVLNRQYDRNTGILISRVIKHLNIIHLHSGGIEIQDTTHEHNLPYTNNSNFSVARPEDILTNIVVQDGYSDIDVDIKMDSILTSPTDINSDITIPSIHIANTISGYLKSYMISGISYNDSDILGQASSITKSNTRLDNNNQFFEKIMTLHNYQDDNWFTFSDLKMINPDVDSRTEIYTASAGVVEVSAYNTENGEEMYKPTVENRIVTTAVESIASLLTKYMLSSIDLSITNATGNPVIAVLDAKTFVEGINVPIYAEKVRIAFETYIFPTISFNNEALIEMYMNVSILGESYIKLSFNGNPFIVYRIPTFADSTFNPLIITNQGLNQISSGYKQLLDEVSVVATSLNTNFNQNQNQFDTYY